MKWELAGYLGGLLIAIGLMPQLVKTYKTKSAKDISLGWTFIAISGLVMYIIYAAKNLIIPILVFATTEAVMMVLLIIMKVTYDKRNA